MSHLPLLSVEMCLVQVMICIFKNLEIVLIFISLIFVLDQIISAGTGNVSEVPPPAPPRSFSVRQSSNRKSGSSFGSRDASPTSTPQVIYKRASM